MSFIRVDYANARSQAKKLRQASEDCETTIRKLNQLAGQVPDCWEGASAEAFLVAVRRRITELNDLRENFLSVSNHIQRVADELEAREKELKAALEADQVATNYGAGNSGFGGGGGGRGF